MSGLLDQVDLRTQLVGENRLEVLMFRLHGEQLFGINVFKVQEVQQMPKLTLIPRRHPIIVGVTHVRGQTIPVIDLSKAIEMAPMEDFDRCNVIIAEYNMSVQAFMVGSVDRIVNLTWDQVTPPPRGAGTEHYLTAITRVEDKVVEIIDVEKVLAKFMNYANQVSDSLMNQQLTDYLNGQRILIVDDSRIAVHQLSALFGNLGIDVEVARNGVQAWERLAGLKSQDINPAEYYFMMVTDAIAHIKNGNKQGLADLAPLISLLKGEPKASKRKTDQKLLAEGFAPILANQHLEKMLRQVEEYFTDALTHENAAVKSNSADTSQTNPSALKSTAQLHRAKRGYEKPPWKALSIALDKAIRESDLLNIQNLIQQLRAQPSLPLAQRVRAEAIESFLEQQIQSMNTQADALYQQGHIQDAKHLWEMLLTLSPTNEQLSAKVNRAEKVLDNLEALREQTPIPAQESTLYFSEIPDSETSAP